MRNRYLYFSLTVCLIQSTEELFATKQIKNNILKLTKLFEEVVVSFMRSSPKILNFQTVSI